MNCSQAQDLIYLYRPGELTGGQRQELENHLSSCSACAAERKAALETEKRVSAIRNIEPRLDDPALLSGAIMGAITEYNPRTGGGFLALPAWASAPAFRVAACIALFILCGSFFLQSALDATKLSALEVRLNTLSMTGSAAGPVDIRFGSLFDPHTGGLETLPGRVGIGESDIRRWRNDAGVSGALQTLFGRPEGSGTTGFFDYLSKKHPRLASIRIENGLDDREREIIASEGEAFLKEVESLMREGGVHHDR